MARTDPGWHRTALTTHASEESHAAVSPDGRTIAFSASYEGPTEVYTMPIDGGLPCAAPSMAPTRSWLAGRQMAKCCTARANTRPFLTDNWQQWIPRTNSVTLFPLSQASEGSVDAATGTLYFTRFAFQGSNTKRYQGGTAQNIWKFAKGADAAVPLTADWTGTSRAPLVWQNRVYFASDRDGTMNLWSMDLDGHDLKQLTHHVGSSMSSVLHSPPGKSPTSSAPTSTSMTSRQETTWSFRSRSYPTSSKPGRSGCEIPPSGSVPFTFADRRPRSDHCSRASVRGSRAARTARRGDTGENRPLARREVLWGRQDNSRSE